METTVRIIIGKVVRDPFSRFQDCSPGLYLNDRKVESIFSGYEGKKIKVIISEEDSNYERTYCKSDA